MDNKKAVLAIDDVSLNLIVIRDILSKFCDIRIAKSGDIALHILDAMQIDLILLDIEMPGMSGFDFLDIIKDKPRAKDIPVVFVTAHATEQFIEKALALGAAGYITKPFDSNALLNKVLPILNVTSANY